MILPSFLIVIGSAFLLKNLGYISGSAWGIIWPVFFIALGVGILFRKDKGKFFWEECYGWHKKEIDDVRESLIKMTSPKKMKILKQQTKIKK